MNAIDSGWSCESDVMRKEIFKEAMTPNAGIYHPEVGISRLN